MLIIRSLTLALMKLQETWIKWICDNVMGRKLHWSWVYLGILITALPTYMEKKCLPLALHFMFSPLMLPGRAGTALINGNFFTWKKQVSFFFVQIEWQTVVISRYKWWMMIDDDMNTILERLTLSRFCLQPAIHCWCFLMSSVTFWCSVSNCLCNTCSRRRCCTCTCKAVWQWWIGRPTVGWRDRLDYCQARMSPVHRSLANPKTRVWKSCYSPTTSQSPMLMNACDVMKLQMLGLQSPSPWATVPLAH